MTQRLDPSPLKNRDQPWAGMILRASAVLYQRETVFGLSWSEFVMICLKICHLSLKLVTISQCGFQEPISTLLFTPK